MRNIKRTILALAAVSFCATACLDIKDPREIIENSPFFKAVGGIDAEQTWNLASRASVTVTTPSEALVKVYAFDGTTSRLAAAKKVTGTETIDFDAYPNLKEVTVIDMNGGYFKKTAIGGSVDFSGTKTVSPGGDVVSAKLNDNYFPFDYAVVKDDVYTDPFKDISKASPLFSSKSGSFTLNPVWYTSESGQSATIGIYYYDGNGNKQEVKIFQNDKQDNMMQFYPTWGSGEDSWQTYWDAHMPSLGNRGDFGGHLCRSKGIDVTVPANTAFGFYVIGGNDNNSRGYSEAKYGIPPSTGKSENPGPYIGEDLGKYGHMAIIDVDGRKYLAIDDFCELKPHSYKNPEYWHLVFSIDGDLAPAAGGDDPVKFILACEDLGDNADHDFNDVVISISHVAGTTEATVTLLACGGTLSDKIYYNDQNLGEAHQLFNVGPTTMINTLKGVADLTRDPVVLPKITVPEDFTMSDTNMGGFKIVRGDQSGVIAAPDKGNVPYMICVPENWVWPYEFTAIYDAYPEFRKWCNDHTKSRDWYLTANEDKIYHKPEKK